MDVFGIGAAVRGAVVTYFTMARGSGRSTHLVDILKDGDCVVFTNRMEADRILYQCKRRRLDVECIVVSVNDPQALFNRTRSRAKGRTIFDHSWVEQYYLKAIASAEADINKLQELTSARGEIQPEPLKSNCRWIDY